MWLMSREDRARAAVCFGAVVVEEEEGGYCSRSFHTGRGHSAVGVDVDVGVGVGVGVAAVVVIVIVAVIVVVVVVVVVAGTAGAEAGAPNCFGCSSRQHWCRLLDVAVVAGGLCGRPVCWTVAAVEGAGTDAWLDPEGSSAVAARPGDLQQCALLHAGSKKDHLLLLLATATRDRVMRGWQSPMV
jgi:hypothetical protein